MGQIQKMAQMAKSCAAPEQRAVFRQAVASLGDLKFSEDLQAYKDTETIKVGTPGWQERYLQQKFGLEPNAKNYARKYEKLRSDLSRDYLRGLVWVLRYYYHQCKSWSWYFPHHFSPPLSMIKASDLTSTDLDLSGPFRPFEQLLSVMPLPSAEKTVPKILYDAVSAPNSTVLDFYPSEFGVDLHNCPPPWMAVATLPFIDEERLLRVIQPIEDSMTDKDLLKRNGRRPGVVITNRGHPLAQRLQKTIDSQRKGSCCWFATKEKDSGNYCVIEYIYKTEAGEVLFGMQRDSFCFA